MKFVAAYLASGLTFAALDAVWLTLAGPRLYRPALDPVLADRFNLPAAVAFYLIYIAGVIGLAVLPAAREGAGLARAAGYGAFLGFVAYATYDLTNQATLRVWALKVTLADIAWGTILTGCAAAAGYAAYRWLDSQV